MFSDDELQRIQTAVSRDSIFDFVSLEGERAFFDDMLQRVYSDDGNGDGRITPEGVELLTNSHRMWNSQLNAELDFHEQLADRFQKVLAPASLFVVATRKQMTEKVDELYSKIEERFPVPYHLQNYDEIEEEISSVGIKYIMIDQLFPAIQQVNAALSRAVANQHGVTAGIAVMRYRRDHGEYPESLEVLIGEYLEEMPIDQLNGQPLNYVRTEDSFKIYSVGHDGDDDGGTPIMILEDGGYPNPNWNQEVRDQLDWRPQRASEFQMHRGADSGDGDWVIWPRYSFEAE